MREIQVKNFVHEKLRDIAHLKEKTIKNLLTYECIKTFIKAFTIPEYEFLEFKGDTMVNNIAGIYIRNRFPKVISIKWLTKLKQNALGTEVLNFVARRGGFIPLIMGTKNEKLSKEHIIEDVIEAFIAAIGVMCGDNISAYESISYSILSYYYDQYDFNLDVEKQIDSFSRLKELYDHINTAFPIENHWKLNKITDRSGDKYTKTIIGFPIGDKTNKKQNMIILANITAQSPGEAITLAANKALIELKKYGIHEIIQNPFKHAVKKDSIILDKQPEPPTSFSTLFKIFLSNTCTPKCISIFTPLKIKDVYQAFVSETYASTFNNTVYKYLGVGMCDLILTEYMLKSIGTSIKDEKSLTRIRQQLTSGHAYPSFMKNYGFDKFVLEKEEIITNTQLASVFKAFVGIIMDILDNEEGFGAGITVLTPLIELHFKNIDLKISKEEGKADPMTIFNQLNKETNIIVKELSDPHRFNVIVIVDGKTIVNIISTLNKKEAKKEAVIKALSMIK